MAQTITPTLDPEEQRYYLLDWATNLLNTDANEQIQSINVIQSAQAAADGNNQLDSGIVAGTKTHHKWTGGTVGTDYSWAVEATTLDDNALDQVRRRTVIVQVRNKPITTLATQKDQIEELIYPTDWSGVLNKSLFAGDSEVITAVTYTKPANAAADSQTGVDVAKNNSATQIEYRGGVNGNDYVWPVVIDTQGTSGRTQKLKQRLKLEVREK